MRGTRAKKIKKLLEEKNFDLLIAVRNRCGEKTKTMTEKGIYRNAKHIWTEKGVF